MKKLLVYITVLILLFGFSSADAESAANVTSPSPTIRVQLRRLNITDRIDLWLDGKYTLTSSKTDLYLPAGSKVTFQIREGTVIMFCNGMSIDIGSMFILIQHGGRGMQFYENGNFYPGNLAVSFSGAVLNPVLTLSVEDYLLGVVPYEMSESFPLEALKAQAVCARTYALSHRNPKADWDVTDTTNDQVFKGIDYRHEKTRKAVEETAGVVGGLNGTLATCFYGASNGGQTELPNHVWGGNDKWEYYASFDDSYDVENPESVVRRTKISKNGDLANENFKICVMSAISEKMEKAGFLNNPEDFRVDSIHSVSLSSPKYEAPNRQYTVLTLTFSWSGKKAAASEKNDEISLSENCGEPVPQQQKTDFIPGNENETVELNIFPEVIRALNLSINYSDNEMLTVTENEDYFIVESRRYGHGVGMSQRGAQWMADKYGKKFHEILAYYYPGMILMRAPFGKAELPTPQPLLANSPAPAASPTPRPTVMPLTKAPQEGQWVASVENVDDGSTLNLRESPDLSSAILMRLMKHQRLLVTEEVETGEWVRVETDSVSGYVMMKYLSPVEDEIAEDKYGND